jgi:hypothetical protein
MKLLYLKTNGVLQGDVLRTQLFSITASDVIKAIQSDNRRAKIYAYADGMNMVSASIQELQESSSNFVQWAEDDSLQINIGKI